MNEETLDLVTIIHQTGLLSWHGASIVADAIEARLTAERDALREALTHLTQSANSVALDNVSSLKNHIIWDDLKAARAVLNNSTSDQQTVV